MTACCKHVHPRNPKSCSLLSSKKKDDGSTDLANACSIISRHLRDSVATVDVNLFSKSAHQKLQRTTNQQNLVPNVRQHGLQKRDQTRILSFCSDLKHGNVNVSNRSVPKPLARAIRTTCTHANNKKT